MSSSHHDRPLRRGWTTGACATAATKAALTALATGTIPDTITITLPKGRTPTFAIESGTYSPNGKATASIRKDAGDDPDVTHRALISAAVQFTANGTGVTFHAGPGVGTVTKPGLPLPVGQPAINPAPRQQICTAIAEVVATHQCPPDVSVTISVAGGQDIANHTWNPRLGILGGISILGTTGVVIPYSCSAWIDSIRRGIDVARALELTHVVGCTGNTSETAAARHLGVPPEALLDSGDFIGATLKYLRKHPVPHATIAAGFAKATKLADGHLDLHSARSAINLPMIAQCARHAGGTDSLAADIISGNTALHALNLCTEHGVDIAAEVARRAQLVAQDIIGDSGIAVSILIVNRTGDVIAHHRPEHLTGLPPCLCGTDHPRLL